MKNLLMATALCIFATPALAETRVAVSMTSFDNPFLTILLNGIRAEAGRDKNIELLVEDAQAAGFYAGLQYFCSTFFSAAGTLLTSFWFVLLFDVDQILLLLFGITEAVALTAFLLSRKRV